MTTGHDLLQLTFFGEHLSIPFLLPYRVFSPRKLFSSLPFQKKTNLVTIEGRNCHCHFHGLSLVPKICFSCRLEPNVGRTCKSFNLATCKEASSLGRIDLQVLEGLSCECQPSCFFLTFLLRLYNGLKWGFHTLVD